MVDPVSNFPFSTIATAPSPATSGTSLVVASGDGSKFPATAVGNYNAIVCPVGVQPSTTNAEIVRVTVLSGDTFTITRTQESSSARTIVVGDQFYLGVTAKMIADLSSQTNVQVFTSSGTWTKPAGTPKNVHVDLVSGGGGGGAGRRGAALTVRGGGGGGGGGGYNTMDLPASALGATVTVTVGAIGAGGIAQAVDSTNGASGSNGGVSSFGTYAVLPGGGSGAGGSTSGGGPGGGGSSKFYGGSGGTGGGTGAANNGNGSGGGGGASGGGSINAADAVQGASVGGASQSHDNGDIVGPNSNGPSPLIGAAIPGGGGGGGTASLTIAGNPGGAGGSYGGGGAGGAGSLNGFASGAGGNGGPGIVVVTTTF
jgi:hypothetical protein